jgi:hypothetical protein
MYKSDDPLNQPENENCYIVYLNVYSGRPDPAWYLSNKDSFDFNVMLYNLPKTDKRIRSNLGYRGFTIDDSGICSINVCDGVIEVRVGAFDNVDVKYYEDVDGKVEKWLLSKAREFGELKALLDHLNQFRK